MRFAEGGKVGKVKAFAEKFLESLEMDDPSRSKLLVNKLEKLEPGLVDKIIERWQADKSLDDLFETN